MISRRQIKVEREGLIGLKNLVEVYEEIAAARMQKVRGAVLQSRLFMQGLLDVFSRVRAAYKKSNLKDSKQSLRTSRQVAVFISANTGLYGDIVDRTFEKFASYVRANKPDVVVLGKLGAKMMTERLPEVLYNYFDFSDEGIDLEAFDVVMRYLIQFESIIVFHGQFSSILSQEPRQSVVSGEKIVVNEIVRGADYLFEPDVKQIARVFEGEILASLFEQTLHESALAKFASRLLSLDRSVDSIDRRVERVRIEERKVTHRIRNRKQLATISGISLWG